MDSNGQDNVDATSPTGNVESGVDNTEAEAPTTPSTSPAKPKAAPAEAAPAPVQTRAPVLKGGFVWGTGRRKSSVARVRVRPGSGEIKVNGKKLEVFFPTHDSQGTVCGPMNVTRTREKYDVYANVNGGGITGQAGAIALGVGRALREFEPALEPTLREAGFLTRDSRMKERKKYGLRGARRAFQFSKR